MDKIILKLYKVKLILTLQRQETEGFCETLQHLKDKKLCYRGPVLPSLRLEISCVWVARDQPKLARQAWAQMPRRRSPGSTPSSVYEYERPVTRQLWGHRFLNKGAAASHRGEAPVGSQDALPGSSPVSAGALCMHQL
ncbi:hypothetical protein Y1Q_0014002 [Alligator mississippiensis]|uniref:Uncharacterized protein n=1 Tax=Alligator mississippiensis TaxID=8496 RepID=A0A151PDL5_ALLMI|nr:hypothetical protein Y1Q_0014002 [Alligator mississippiensis]